MYRFLLYILLHPKKFITAVLVVFQGPKEFKRRIRINYNKSNYKGMLESQYIKWFKRNYPSINILKLQKKIGKKFIYQPKISIVLPTFNTPLKFLRESVESVINQSYQNWELCIADDASTDKKIREVIMDYVSLDKRIKCVFREKNGHISEASNSALKVATGEFVGLLDHDDFLWPNALFEVTSALNKNKRLDFIYSDEDKISMDGKIHFGPFFKPNWNPDYLRSANYIVHFTVLRKSLIDKIGGFRSEYNGAQDWDLFLRATRSTKKILHIPKVLYSWRVSKTSTATEGKAAKIKGYAFVNQEKVLKDDLLERGLNGEILSTKQLGIWRVKYKIKGHPLVSIIIPTKNQYRFISECLDAVLSRTIYNNFEIIIVDSGSEDSRVFELYKKIKAKHKKTKVLKWTEKFNFAKVCNYGALLSCGEYLIFLNNDTKVITPEWIESMLEHAQRGDVGAVGCKLLFDDNTIQHAGVILGMRNKKGKNLVAGHAFRGLIDHHPGTHLIDSIRDYSAVTAACLMISKQKFIQVKGFDEIFRVAFNDVDFCLKLLKAGYVNVYTPFSVLYHFESVSVGQLGEKKRDMTEYKKEVQLFLNRWKDLVENDPQYNINLTKSFEDFSIGV